MMVAQPLGATVHVNLIRLVIAIQILCAIAFIVKFIGDVFLVPALQFRWETLEFIELATILSLLIGTGISIYVIQQTMARNKIVEDQLRVASGDFQTVIDEKFALWNLTKAEREVALLTIKGFSVGEVAELRGKSEGTIKAQNAAIYRKAGVGGRAQLLVLFVEDMVDAAISQQPNRSASACPQDGSNPT